MGLVATVVPELALVPVVRQACEAHAAAVAPEEACGILLWFGGTARGYIPARNAAPRPYVEFLVDLGMAAWDPLLDVEARGVCKLGLWHSHARGVAQPSREDVALYDVGWAGRPYALYSLAADAWWLGKLLPQ